MLSGQDDGRLYRCKGPGCSNVRGVSNHWFVIYIRGVTFCSSPFNEELIRELVENRVTVNWVCGHTCAQRFYEKFLGT